MNNIINEDDYICQDTLAEIGLKARALYDYQAGIYNILKKNL